MPNNEKGPDIFVPKIKAVRVGRDKDGNVIWEIEGEKVQRLPWQAAIPFAARVMANARAIEEQVKAPETVKDQAFLLSKGVPIGLTRNRDILRAAGNEAAQIKGTKIESVQRVFTPSITQSPPKEVSNGKEH